MTSARCPACGAAVATGAPWCTLCYADLRPRAAEPSPPPAGPPPAAELAPAEAEGTLLTATASVSAEAPTDLDAPVLTHADAALRGTKGWPCHVCGTTVAMESDTCTDCGASFLAGVDPTPVPSLPLVGDPRQLTPAARFGVMIGGIIVVALFGVLVAFVLGQLG